MEDKELATVVIDFTKDNELNEHWTDFWAGAVSNILRSMMGGYYTPMKVTGTTSQINSFANTLGREKDYIKAIKDYGLDDPKTHSNKFKLNKAIKEFERATKLKWPFQ